MDKLFRWLGSNILFICTLLLLIIIPLYPKIPLVDIQNTWVYVRVEDFVVVFVLFVWVVLLVCKKVSLKTPLTIPIFLFWIIGGIATLHGVFLLFSTLEGVHANVAFLSYLRRIEYMSLFFVAYASIRDKKSIYYVIFVLTFVLLLIIGYGFGQRFLGFPAFLTMNEEFAKGIPIQLNEFSRISSTFAGHYDLAAYLVLIIPILTSMMFGFKNLFIKGILLATSLLGFVLLFMTISRVSFIVLLVSLGIVFMFQKKRLVIISLVVVTLLLVVFSKPLVQRFGSTVSEVEVLVNAKTGVAIGPVKEVPNTHFLQTRITIKDHNQNEQSSSTSAILPYGGVPETAAVLIEPNRSNGEDLTQGTSYINLSLSPVTRKVGMYFFEKVNNVATSEADVYFGEYVIKKAKAYDLSATTRFQGEWPRTLDAFKKNIFLGSGYGSVSLAVDNNYLRILGESGILGLLAFFSIFIFAGIYIKMALPKVDSPVLRTFVLGFVAGSIGLGLNAVLIDVFEASKVAFTYWLLMGITLGMLHLYIREGVDMVAEFKKVMTSAYAVGIYLFIIIFALFFSVYANYFVSMDYTWLRFASSCYNGLAGSSVSACQITFQTFLNFFSQTTEGLYRPATLVYFHIMHTAFWLDQTVYHVISLSLYFIIAILVFLLLKQIFKNTMLSVIGIGLYVLLAGHVEVLLSISATDMLFATLFTLLSVLSFTYWEEKRKIVLFITAFLSAIIAPFFHEAALMIPLLIILYDVCLGKNMFVTHDKHKNYIFLFIVPLVVYLLARFMAYGQIEIGSYAILMAPVNLIGYAVLGVLGSGVLSLSAWLHQILGTTIVQIVFFLLVCGVIAAMYALVRRYVPQREGKILIFGFLFFLIATVPFLGMQALHSQYGYLANIGLVILLAMILKGLYIYLKKTQDAFIANSAMVIIALIFLMLQVFQIQAVERSWKDVSGSSEQFLISMNEHYSDTWKSGQWDFYFVNVPDGQGQPWEKPSSLEDAIWFVTQNPKTNIHVEEKLGRALDFADMDSHVRVFEFQQDGSVKYVIRKTIKGKTMIIKD